MLTVPKGSYAPAFECWFSRGILIFSAVGLFFFSQSCQVIVILCGDDAVNDVVNYR